MLTDAQIQDRLSGIGSSDAGAVLGVNPYRTADDVLQDKLGKPGFKGNEATHWGNVMEPILRKEYEKRTGHKVKTRAKAFRMRLWPYIIAHVDGIIKADDMPGDGVLELKCMRYPPKDMKKHYHYCQLQHGLLVTGLKWGVIAPLFGGNEFKVFEYERDEDYLKEMLQVYEKFWARVLDARKQVA